MKKLIALAIAALPAAAMADVVIYGEAGAALENTKTTIDGNPNGPGSTNGSVTKVENYNSKIGFKGTEDLGNGLKAIWQVEQKIGIDGTGDNKWATRDSFVGLTGDFGTVQLGRLSNFQNVYSNLDPWKSEGGWNAMSWAQETGSGTIMSAAAYQSRLNNAIAYTSPEMGGFMVRALYSAAGEGRTTNGQTENVYELGLRYAMAGFYGQYSYTQSKNADLLGVSTGTDNGVAFNNFDQKSKMHYVEAGYDANNLLVALNYVQAKHDGINQNDGESLKTRAMGLNVAYTMGAFQPHFQYQHGWKNSTNVGDEAGTNFNQYVLGLNYLMSKRTMAHVAAGYVKSGDNEQGEAALKGTTYAVGLTHLF
ncbi:Probable outer membrane porin [Laribacter hongkongensis HLHK9]|uniref:Probable outer membrane porin n=1 Tax=Laribacter hongkongensis (strain HLHK9) TaxID=557598 RepID=C1DB86_LARHH|nr:porin [Laribacter hongkongensis]ACO75425.1 Probable outer membrane porin [Laribacter hongkongensis HLHK9]